MKFLHEVFKEELSDDSNLRVQGGYIYIRSRVWSAVDIIELARKPNGENDVFTELFDEWLQERIERKIEEADEILGVYEQQDRFSSIVEAFKKCSVMPFVGAGLSIPSGYPGWTNFLRKQRRQTRISEEVIEALLKSGKYEEAAQLFADEQAEAFSESIENSFASPRKLTGAVGLLPYIFKGSIITTNFDSVIERSYQNADDPILEKLSGDDSKEIKKLLSSNVRFLLMLHGKATSTRGRILTKAEYDTHYSNGHTLKKTIKAICDNRTLLFLGCSLTVDRTLVTIREYVNEEGHNNLPKHYAFLEEPDSEEERINRQKMLAECHIYPIWYPRDTHNESIEALLIKLKETARQ